VKIFGSINKMMDESTKAEDFRSEGHAYIQRRAYEVRSNTEIIETDQKIYKTIVGRDLDNGTRGSSKTTTLTELLNETALQKTASPTPNSPNQTTSSSTIKISQPEPSEQPAVEITKAPKTAAAKPATAFPHHKFTQGCNLPPEPMGRLAAGNLRVGDFAVLWDRPCVIKQVEATTKKAKANAGKLSVVGEDVLTGEQIEVQLRKRVLLSVPIVTYLSSEESGFEEITMLDVSLNPMVPVQTLHKGECIMLKKRPARIAALTESQLKIGARSSVFSICATDLFTGVMLREGVKRDTMLEIPTVTNATMTLLEIAEDGLLTLLDEDGAVEENVRLNSRLKLGKLEADWRDGAVDIQVDVLEAKPVGEKEVMSWSIV
jgi:translation initiation factor 5A